MGIPKINETFKVKYSSDDIREYRYLGQKSPGSNWHTIELITPSEYQILMGSAIREGNYYKESEIETMWFTVRVEAK